MPVSPQDFALWSNLTGNPYPQTPAERMALAPQVYEFNRNLGRSGGPIMSPTRRAVDVVGKAALAAGALAGAAYLGSKYLGGGDDDGGGGLPVSFGKLDLDNEPSVGSTVAEAAPDLNSQVARNSGDITDETTAGNYSQNLNPNQTSAVQEAKGLSSFKPTTSPIEDKPATQSEVIATRQYFSPGTEEEMLGQGAAERAAAFRKSKAYAMMQKQYPSLREPDEGLIGGPGGEPESVIITEPVRQPAAVRVAKPAVVVEESPIAEMVSVKAAPAPVTTTPVSTVEGPSTQQIREMDALLARTHARHTPEQRAEIRNKYFAEKFGNVTAEPIVTTTQPSPVRVAVEPTSKPATVKVNEFLSKMSQEQGPVATYEIDPSRSKAVSGLAFYPGGELGITHSTKKGDREYVYNVSDPMRLAMSDYAEENFPSGFGSIGGLVNAARNPVWLGQIKPISR